ncbi:MAG: acyl carrier protein [Rhodospirillaceae bacterium]|nr:acyl carrier protein [Rhodospirillaceae bacterium]
MTNRTNNSTETQDRIVDHLREIDPTLINATADPRAILLRRLLDSIGMFDFIAFLETAFSIQIKDEEVVSGNFESVASVVEFVEAKRSLK